MTTLQPVKFRQSAFTTIVVFIVLVILGLALFPRISIHLKNTTVPPILSVSYNYPGRPPRIVEQEVTSRLEGMFNTIRGVTNISSTSNVGSGYITLTFDKREDMEAIRFEVATLIREIYPKLPEDVSHPEIAYRRIDSDDQEMILSYRLNSPAPPPVIQEFAINKLKPALSDIVGLSEISISGAQPMEWELTYDQNQLSILNISFTDIRAAISSAFSEQVIGIGNEKEGTDKPLAVKSIVLRTALEEQLNNFDIPIKNVNGRVVRLFDLCKIRRIEKMPSSYFRINGENFINMRFFSDKGANTIVVADEIKERIEELRPILPPGYDIKLQVDSTKQLKDDLNRIAYRALFSVIILLIFVFIISRKFRYLLIIVFSLFANLSIALIFYYLLNVDIHLFSLAGITVSLGIIIDNTIVMIDHIRFKKNKKVFIAVFAATLTTIGALSVIFFLDETTRLDLVDFSLVVMINLAVSLFIALFFIPALLEKIPLKQMSRKRYYLRRRKIIKFSRIYGKYLNFSIKWRKLYFVFAILIFGLPIFWLPAKIDKETKFAETYNKTLGSDWYKEKLKPVLDKSLGGTLRLFSENIRSYRSYYRGGISINRLVITARVSMHEGASLEQLNHLVMRMEKFLSEFDQINYYTTNLYKGTGRANGTLQIHFKPEFEAGPFPYYLNNQMHMKGISLGGPDWTITGIPQQSFYNSIREGTGNHKITLYGYNYEKLMTYAEDLAERISRHDRVGEINIMGENRGTRDYSVEYHLNVDKQYLANKNLTVQHITNSLANLAVSYNSSPLIEKDGKKEYGRFKSIQSGNFDKWQMYHVPVKIGNTLLKLDEKGELNKETQPKLIVKENQQYVVIVEYDFTGNYKYANKYEKEKIEETKSLLPLGFFVKESTYNYWRLQKKQYYLIFLVIGIIFFICSILLESLKQPLVVVLMIPLSFIGVFLTFYFFKLGFDRGGFASFLLLSGITVNSALFILNDYNNIRKKPGYNRTKLITYLKAYNGKIIPVFLTIISTILGLLPFLLGEQKEVFWFSLASGTIGGLLFSIVAIVIFLPVFMNVNNEKIRSKEKLIQLK